MFDVTGEDIAKLNDEDLRALIGRLCEAELDALGHSAAAVTWGGNQTAKDGGVDVRVALPAETQIGGFVPRRSAVFQSKATNMPRAEVLGEMKPNGQVRQEILDLAAEGGAYIIVSSAGSTSDAALKNRQKAMQDAVEGIPNSGGLHVDFYDRSRIATWVRRHPGAIAWVRLKVGRPIEGWRGHDHWSRVPDGVDSSYLLDESTSLRTSGRNDGEAVRATEGIRRMREILRKPRGVVRLVGVSGVGKTRLAEALFDPNVGDNSLQPTLAVYTDVADSPDPGPVALASRLAELRERAIIVIDNCAPDLHKRLADIVVGSGSALSILTIEYDIRDDHPEGTEVFVLDTSSIPLIEALAKRRHPTLSRLDAKRIAEFSGGNARIALALASTVQKSESLAQLAEADLFHRLFHQRNSPDASLLTIAQVLALVYSFDGDTVEGPDSELAILAALVGSTPGDLFRGAAELKARDLLQRRGQWRAVLPHAIANKLAANALVSIPSSKILSTFQGGSLRLLRSFSRRLGFLHESEEARFMVRGWLSPGGLLSDIGTLNEDGRAMLANVAPVEPSAMLSALERHVANADEAALRGSTHIASLLRSLAYDPDMFERAIGGLVKIHRLSMAGEFLGNEADPVSDFFQIFLSGTQAPLSLRLNVLAGLLASEDPSTQVLAGRMIRASLKTVGFVGRHDHEFGARSRDYGFRPAGYPEVLQWFSTVLTFLEPYVTSNGPGSETARDALASRSYALWTTPGLEAALERLYRTIAARGFWKNGWRAVREMTQVHAKDFPPTTISRLSLLEKLMRPVDLVSRVRAVVLSGFGEVDLDDLKEGEHRDRHSAMERAAATAERLGREAAGNDEALRQLLPELTAGGMQTVHFGRGLATAIPQLKVLWARLAQHLGEAVEGSAELIGGFLEGTFARDEALANDLLDDAVAHPTLARWFPALQRTGKLDKRAIDRVCRSIELGVAPIERFGFLARGEGLRAIPGTDFKRMIQAILSNPSGVAAGRELVFSRVFADREEKDAMDREVADSGRRVLEACRFGRAEKKQIHDDYQLGTIARVCLVGESARASVRMICGELRAAYGRHDLHADEYGDLMRGLFAVHADEVFETLFSGDAKFRRQSVAMLQSMTRFQRNLMDEVSDSSVLRWCERDPIVRFPIVAAVVPLFKRPKEKEPHEWIPLANSLLTQAPSAPAVLSEIVARLYPNGWSGSLAEKLESRLELLGRLDIRPEPSLSAAFAAAKDELQKQVRQERANELAEDRWRDERFE